MNNVKTNNVKTNITNGARVIRVAMTKADFIKASVPADIAKPKRVRRVAPVAAPVAAPVIAPAQTPAQVAAIAEMRAAKAVAAASLATSAAKIAADIQAANDALPPFIASSTHAGDKGEALADRFYVAVREMLTAQGVNMPSWKRRLAAFFSSIVLSGGAGYAIGTLAGYAILGIATLGGSILWAYLIMVCAVILAAYAGLKIGQVVGNYVLSGQIDADVVAAKNKVKGWFTFGKSKAKAALAAPTANLAAA